MEVTKEQIELIKVMRDMKYDKEQALGILLLSCEYNLVNETIKYIKGNQNATEEDVFGFLLGEDDEDNE